MFSQFCHKAVVFDVKRANHRWFRFLYFRTTFKYSTPFKIECINSYKLLSDTEMTQGGGLWRRRSAGGGFFSLYTGHETDRLHTVRPLT